MNQTNLFYMTAVFLQLMQLNVEASLKQEPNLLHGIFNRQLQDRKKSSSNINYLTIEFIKLFWIFLLHSPQDSMINFSFYLDINMVRDAGRDNKICGQPNSPDRIFFWPSSYNQMATEEECKAKCLAASDCVAVSVTSTSLVKWCVGCKVAPTTISNKKLKVFKKTIGIS